MKSPVRLQQKLHAIINQQREFRLIVPERPWSREELAAAASTIEHYLSATNSVIADPLQEWLEEFSFYRSELKNK